MPSMPTTAEKAAQLYNSSSEHPDKDQLARMLRAQLENPNSIRTVHQRLTAIISYPFSRIVQHFADISHLEFKG